MTYYVTIKVEGRYVAQVEANSIEEAKEAGMQEFWFSNLNEMEDIEGEPIIIEDEKGEYVYEK